MDGTNKGKTKQEWEEKAENYTPLIFWLYRYILKYAYEIPTFLLL